MSRSLRRTGGQVLVDQLRIHGTDMAFCVPGESFLGALDALYDARETIRLITCRHEAPACNMAEASGKLTGRPGICFVTRGPGASHAAVGIHIAYQDSTPLILFVGLIERAARGRQAFQEIDLEKMFGHTTKWTTEINDPARIPELLSRAFHLAVSGRPGPIVLGIPEDMLVEYCETEDADPYQVVRPAPNPASIQKMREMIASAERPLMIIGGGGWTAKAVEDLMAFASANNLPALTSFRRADRFDNHHSNYVGDLSGGSSPEVLKRVRESDLLLVVGAHLSESATHGYTLLVPPKLKQRLIHVHADPDELGRVYEPTLPICSGMEEFCAAACAMRPVGHSAWDGWTAAARRDYLENLKPSFPAPGTLDLGKVMEVIRARLPRNSITTSDAGNFSGWLNRFYQWSEFPTMLGPIAGSMGYSVPAAVSASLRYPERTVVGFAGDGGFLMSAQELATAVQFGGKPIFIVINNGMYGTIRAHQERHYPGRYPATDLRNPDFAMFAQAFGAHGEVVTATAEFAGAFERALNAGKPAVLELRIDPEQISSRTTLTAMREATLARRAKGN